VDRTIPGEKSLVISGRMATNSIDMVRQSADNPEAASSDTAAHSQESTMPFDTTTLDGDFVPMNHREVQPIAATVRRVFDEDGREIEGFHHIMNGQTGATIRVAPDTYTMVQNEVAVDTIESALKQSRLDLTDARFGVDYSHDGARMFAQWILPAHTALVKPGVEATLRLVLLNSYDGTSALVARTGAYNWVCANTSVSGKEFASFRFTHSGEIDLSPAVAKLTRAAEEHVEQVHRWEQWPHIPVTDQSMRAVMASIPKASESQIDALIHAYLKARDEDEFQGGANLWCLFNVLTAWASEKDVSARSANRAYRNWGRQKDVGSVVESKLWQELAAQPVRRLVHVAAPPLVMPAAPVVEAEIAAPAQAEIAAPLPAGVTMIG
jgi:hypothetical protein